MKHNKLDLEEWLISYFYHENGSLAYKHCNKNWTNFNQRSLFLLLGVSLIFCERSPQFTPVTVVINIAIILFCRLRHYHTGRFLTYPDPFWVPLKNYPLSQLALIDSPLTPICLTQLDCVDTAACPFSCHHETCVLESYRLYIRIYKHINIPGVNMHCSVVTWPLLQLGLKCVYKLLERVD